MNLRVAIPLNQHLYLFKANHRNTRAVYEICSNLTIKTSEWRFWRWSLSDDFIVSFEQISHIPQVFPLLTLNK